MQRMSLVCRLTRTSGSHSGFLGSVDDAELNMPIGGPRKLSQTSRRRDSSASLHIMKKKHERDFIKPKASTNNFHLTKEIHILLFNQFNGWS